MRVRYATVLLLAACGAEVASDTAPVPKPQPPRLVRLDRAFEVTFPPPRGDQRPPPQNDVERAFREVDQSPHQDLR